MSAAKFSWKGVLPFLLASFFLIGAAGNIFASEGITADYARWGYSNWFHYVTGSLELITAMLLAGKPLRFWGAALGTAIMLGAATTVVLHGEYAHAIAPFVVLTISIAVGWINRPNNL